MRAGQVLVCLYSPLGVVRKEGGTTGLKVHTRGLMGSGLSQNGYSLSLSLSLSRAQRMQCNIGYIPCT